MNLRLLIVLCAGAFIAGVCTADDNPKKPTTFSPETKELMDQAYYLGYARESFKRDCKDMDPYALHTPKKDIDYCSDLVRLIHQKFRALTPKMDDELLTITEPFVNSFDVDFKAGSKAEEIFQKHYDLDEKPYKMLLDKYGDLRRYHKKPNSPPIDLVPATSAQRELK